METLLSQALSLQTSRADPSQKSKRCLTANKTRLILKVEEINERNSVVKLKFWCYDIELTRGNVYFIIKRFRDDDDYVAVYTSETIRNHRYDENEWEEFEIEMTVLCNGDEYKPLRFELFEQLKKGKIKMLGAWDFSLWDIHTDKKLDHRLQNDKNIIGMIRCLKWEVDTKYTFLDYLFGGWGIEVVIAIDFTLTNKPINDPKSLHHIPDDDHENFYIDQDGNKVNSK